MTIKNIGILGAGALGAVYATRFSTHSQFTTVLIANDQRAKRLKQNGFIVNDTAYHLPVSIPEKSRDPLDLIIVAVKHHHLDSALPDLEPYIGPDTSIISVMNGLDSENIIGARYGMDKVLYAIAVGIDALRTNNSITYTTVGKILCGEAENNIISPRVKAVQQAIQSAGIGCEVPPDMIRTLWWKFMVNVGTNQASAVTRAPYGVFQTDRNAQNLMETLMEEVINLATAADVNLVKRDIDEWYKFLNTLSPQGKTSMLQDIEAKRVTEADIFGGKVVELGVQYGIPTPVNKTVLNIIRIIESNY